MKVPYSMDDSEPDLYGGLGGYHNNDYYESRNVTLEYVELPKFYTQEDMDKVIQHNLKSIAELRKEIDKAYEDGYDKGYWSGRDDGYHEGYGNGLDDN